MTKRKAEPKAVKQIAVLLYSVTGETAGGVEETEFVIAQDEKAVSEFARTQLEFDVVTAIHLVNTCIHVAAGYSVQRSR